MAMNIDKDIVDFLKRNHVAVLATANRSNSSPHAAAIFYATDSKMNLYFLTKENTTKNKNIQSNPQAALVIYEAERLATAQITGTVSRVENDEMMAKAQRVMAKYSKQTAGTDKTPISKLDAGADILYRITPQSIRLADYKFGVKNYIFEIATPAEESLE